VNTTFTGMVWKAGKSNVVTLPKKQFSAKPGDIVIIKIMKIKDGGGKNGLGKV